MKLARTPLLAAALAPGAALGGVGSAYATAPSADAVICGNAKVTR